MQCYTKWLQKEMLLSWFSTEVSMNFYRLLSSFSFRPRINASNVVHPLSSHWGRKRSRRSLLFHHSIRLSEPLLPCRFRASLYHWVSTYWLPVLPVVINTPPPTHTQAKKLLWETMSTIAKKEREKGKKGIHRCQFHIFTLKWFHCFVLRWHL